jgi:hypothetical protein
MVSGITLPEACAATCISSINVQRMSVHAAISGDIDLLKLAVLHDPLVGAVSTPEEVWQMVDEMVVAQAAGCRNMPMPCRPPRSGCRNRRCRPATGTMPPYSALRRQPQAPSGIEKRPEALEPSQFSASNDTT